MSYDDKRNEIIQRDRQIRSIPSPDYQNMTKEQMKQQTIIIDSLFTSLFEESDDENQS